MACQSCALAINGRKKKHTMAKKRTHKRRHHTRRARVHGVHGGDFQKVGTEALIGGAGAVVLKMVLEKVLPSNYSQYTNYALIAGGILAASSSKNPMVINAGMGAAIVGAYDVVSNLAGGQPTPTVGLLNPYGSPQYRLAGPNDGFGDQIKVL